MYDVDDGVYKSEKYRSRYIKSAKTESTIITLADWYHTPAPELFSKLTIDEPCVGLKENSKNDQKLDSIIGHQIPP